MKRILLFSSMIALLFLAACAGGGAMQEAPASEEFYYDSSAPLPSVAQEAPADAGDGNPAESDGGDVRLANVERIVIQNADLAIVVSDVEVRMKEIQEMAEEMGGFVVSSNIYQ